MSPTAKKLIEQFYQLSEEEREEVRDAIGEGALVDQQSIDDAWRDEVLRRHERAERGEVELIDGEESLRRLRARLAQ